MAFVKLYNWSNFGYIYEIYEIIEFEKIYVLTAENFCSLNLHRIIEISLILCNAHVISKNENYLVLYVNNYINLEQFNQLYDSDRIDKSIKNVDAIAHKFRPVLIKITHYRLEIAIEKRQKKEEMIKKQKIENIAVKRQRARKRISLSS